MAEELGRRGHRCVLLISEKTIDARLVEKYPQHTFRRIAGAPLVLTPAGLLRFATRQARGFAFALALVRRERPEVIVGFGGFTTSAIILAGWLLRVPVALHEANRVPGRAVRALARFARRIYLPRDVSLPQVPPHKIRHAGLPVRAEIERLPRHEAAARFGLDPERHTVAVLGGSQGASALNDWAAKVGPVLAAQGVQLIAITGPGKGGATSTTHPGPGGAPMTVRTLPFCDDMAGLLSSCDLVVSRAGAGTLAELVQCRVPAVLVPYPYAADNHQAANAAEFVRHGAGLMVAEDEIDRLIGVVEDLILHEGRLAELRANCAHLARSDTRGLMLDDLERLGRPPSAPRRGGTRPATA